MELSSRRAAATRSNSSIWPLASTTGTPLIRLAFPIFDRHHHHRFPLWGYQGGLRLVTTILDKIFDKLDEETGKAGQDISFDLTR